MRAVGATKPHIFDDIVLQDKIDAGRIKAGKDDIFREGVRYRIVLDCGGAAATSIDQATTDIRIDQPIAIEIVVDDRGIVPLTPIRSVTAALLAPSANLLFLTVSLFPSILRE